jgi:valyl-tRNA synthetase
MALAVNPSDKRFAHLIGKHDITYAEPSLVGKAIRDFLLTQAKAEA